MDLYRASRHEAGTALARFTSDEQQDRRVASIAAGAAAEYLLACVVVNIDPVLLADPTDIPSAVTLSRRNPTQALNPRKFRSATWGRQVAIVQEVHQALNIREDIRFLLELRNAAVHVALTDKKELTDAVSRMVRVVDTLLPLVPQHKESDYWGARLPVAVEMRDKRSTAVRQRVAAKLAEARARYRSRVTALVLGEAAEAALLLALEASPVAAIVDDSAQEPATCPACSRQGELSYLKVRSDEVQSEVVYDRDLTPEDIVYFHTVIGTPVLFQCPVCELELDGEELNGFDHLTDEIDLDDEPTDRADYWGEPDEDYLRER
ncbi:hypothetical protein [uncultured Microbacterium sp.]|uniref:hypothetical protein n=1 Tax=uncultured Microbacterium sp. TaxID=191216 RepID=UPI002600F9FE|nr:hypothetical protein [uncultured Microbacterium sp.]